MTAHCNVVVELPTSALIAGSRMLTAEVFAFTTSVETHVAASTLRLAGVPPSGLVASVDMAPIVGGGRVSRHHPAEMTRTREIRH